MTMDSIHDITQEDYVISETTKREAATLTFEEAVEAARRATAEEAVAAERARVARRACLKLKPEGMTTTEVARRINRVRY